jgi:UDP-2,4-diacetamido-2,4,6-trideoxy-beta-L-altropyranose hydrolase
MFACICIRADWGPKTGTGHIMRCLALAQAWQDRGGSVRLATTSDSPLLLERVRHENIKIHKISAPIGGNEDALATIRIAKQASSTWVILDGYQFETGYPLLIQQAGLRVLVVDDLANDKLHGCNAVLNPNVYASKDLYYGTTDLLTHLFIGPRFALVRREFLLKIKRHLSPPAQRVQRTLITLGGADPQNATRLLMEALAARVIPFRMHIIIVVGSANPHLASLEEYLPLLERHHNVRLEVNPPNLPELIQLSDLAISAAGGGAMELACLGTPMALIIAAANQSGVASSLENCGAAFLLGDSKQLLSEEKVDAFFQLLEDPDKLNAMRLRAHQIVDGQGAARVAERLAAYPLQIRPARADDARLFYEWASDPLTRQMSFSTAHISWEQHLCWFEKRLHSTKCWLFVGITPTGFPAGQVRLELKDRTATLNLSIAPEQRGRGYASKLARLVASDALTDGWCDEVSAWVKPDNIASLKTFRKAGFEERGIQSNHPDQAVLFVLKPLWSTT